jgi:hypothetical protein
MDTTMTKRESKKKDSIKEKTLQKYVVDEREIREFIGRLSVVDISTVAARFQIVADLTCGAFEERIDRLDESDLALINRIAGEDNGVLYHRLMTAIIAAVGQDRHGINAAHLTARRTVELAFRCTREYFSALHSYSRDLRLRLIDRSASTASSRRRSWKTVSHR